MFLAYCGVYPGGQLGPAQGGYIDVAASGFVSGSFFAECDSKGLLGFIFGFVFSAGANLKDFLGSFLGSFRLTCVAFSFVFNNLSASFLQIKFFCPTRFSGPIRLIVFSVTCRY